jgi:hypothetical protein
MDAREADALVNVRARINALGGNFTDTHKGIYVVELFWYHSIFNIAMSNGNDLYLF